MMFQLVVKRGTETIATILGPTKDKDLITIEDMEKVPEVEQYLERLTGHRFHIHVLEA